MDLVADRPAHKLLLWARDRCHPEFHYVSGPRRSNHIPAGPVTASSLDYCPPTLGLRAGLLPVQALNARENTVDSA